MRKRILSLALAALFAFALIPSMAVYANEEIRVAVDGQQVNFTDQTPL